MSTERLEVRLDPERRLKLRELASQYNAPVSDVVRTLIDRAYEQTLLERRRRAALEMSNMEIEEVPEPPVLSEQLDRAYEAGGVARD